MRRSLIRPIHFFIFFILLAATALPSAGLLHARPWSFALPQSKQDQTQNQNQKQNQKQNQNQSQNQNQTPQPQKGYSSSSTTQAAANSPTDNPNIAPDPHKYDRYHAEQDIEVATFYLHKGDPDAAIPRLQEAAHLRPDYAKPRLLLAECYEKKHDPDNAIKYLKEYLKVYPGAPDTKKVQEKIRKLEKQEQ